MTIDEAIAQAREVAKSNKTKATYDDKFLKRFCTSKKACIKCAEENEQLAEWLEELKAYQQHEIICNKGYNAGYNKAIDDFVNACKENIMCKTFGLRECDIEQVAEQLKESETI